MTQNSTARDIALDQQIALKNAARQLSTEFEDSFGMETIERFLHSSYDEFAGRATVTNFLPLLAERFSPSASRGSGCTRSRESMAT